MATAEQRRVVCNIEAKILAYAQVLAQFPGEKTINGVPLANLITDLFTQLREIEATCNTLCDGND
jgi:hypothetical protein